MEVLAEWFTPVSPLPLFLLLQLSSSAPLLDYNKFVSANLLTISECLVATISNNFLVVSSVVIPSNSGLWNESKPLILVFYDASTLSHVQHTQNTHSHMQRARNMHETHTHTCNIHTHIQNALTHTIPTHMRTTTHIHTELVWMPDATH